MSYAKKTANRFQSGHCGRSAEAKMLLSGVNDPTPTDPEPGNDPFEIEWEGDFTLAERQRIIRLMNEIRTKIDVLLNEADAVEEGMTDNEREYVREQFVAFREMMVALGGVMDSETNLEIGRAFDDDGIHADAEAWMWNGGYFLLVYYDAELTFNDANNWNDLSDDRLRKLIFHELTHLYGTEHGDSGGRLMNVENIEMMINGTFANNMTVNAIKNEAASYVSPPDHPFDIDGDGVYDMSDHMLYGP